MKKICIVVGTRPEIIKMSSIIRVCIKQDVPYFVVHSGQHYSYELDGIFFEQLNLPKPIYNLHIKSSAPNRQGEHTGKMLIEMEDVFLKEKPDIVLVQGDTNTVLAGTLCASKLHIPVGHVEAGLRSYDQIMPEEVNRKICDHLADYLFVPTEKEREICLGEKIDSRKIFITGNTIVDAVLDNVKLSEKEKVLEKLEIETRNYFVVTTHRPENVDNKEKLTNIIKLLEKIDQKYNIPIVFLVHPRTEKMFSLYGLKIPQNIKKIDPLGFLEFIHLEKNARLILTDSGGIQEEACILKVPCVTLRENTERTETVDVGANIIAGTDTENVLRCVETMLDVKREWENPFGNGKAGETIIKYILKNRN